MPEGCPNGPCNVSEPLLLTLSLLAAQLIVILEFYLYLLDQTFTVINRYV
jgi:hypothetical protein